MEGGKAEQAVTEGLPDSGDDAGFAVGNAGIYFLAKDRKTVRLLDPATGRIRLLAGLDKPALEIAASPDGRYVIWTQVDRENYDLMLVENFR